MTSYKSDLGFDIFSRSDLGLAKPELTIIECQTMISPSLILEYRSIEIYNSTGLT